MSEQIDVVVGRVGKPHGLRGEVTVEVRTDEPDRRFAAGTTLRAEPPRGSAASYTSLTVGRTRWHQGRLLVTFEEFADRTAAEAARGIVLSVTVDPWETPEDPDEFYDHQLVELAVHDLEGRALGGSRPWSTGAPRTCSPSAPPTAARRWCPFVAALVPEVDLAGRTGRGRRPPGPGHALPGRRLIVRRLRPIPGPACHGPVTGS